MAISDDTTALVAAQLTVAWATRMGAVKNPDPAHPIDAQIARIYSRFRRSVAEIDLRPSAFDQI